MPSERPPGVPWRAIAVLAVVASVLWFAPLGVERFDWSLLQGLELLQWYVRRYLLLTLIPAFLLAGAVAAFLNRDVIVRYLGRGVRKVVAYSVAAVCGSVIAVCSCAVLPIFASIRQMGAGLGPATTFLYAGPAINLLAIILTARLLGIGFGVARAVAAVTFSVVIGLLMQFIFRHDVEEEEGDLLAAGQQPRPSGRRSVLVLATLIAAMMLANWASSGNIKAVMLCCPGGASTFELQGEVIEESESHVTILSEGERIEVHRDDLITLDNADSAALLPAPVRWSIVCLLLLVGALMMRVWFPPETATEWTRRTWSLARNMLPALAVGVFVAGFLLGSRGEEGLIPRVYIEALVGAKPELFLSMSGLLGGATEPTVRAVWPVWTNLFASVVGIFMYFATLTEVPIVQGLMRAGMGRGPALALLLAGPAVSLPNMLVIWRIMGGRRTVTYLLLVVIMATISGLVYGTMGS